VAKHFWLSIKSGSLSDGVLVRHFQARRAAER